MGAHTDAFFAVATGDGLGIGLLVAALLLGLRHGIDWDHIAAITDIAATQNDRRRGVWLGSSYVIGHALVVFALGLVAILAGQSLPRWLDEAMGTVVGWTLLILGGYVVYSLIASKGDFRLQSRWMLLIGGVRRAVAVGRRMLGARRAPDHVAHDHAHLATPGFHHEATERDAREGNGGRRARTHRHAHVHAPVDPNKAYGTGSAVAVGMLHGVGAETPTQILVFLAAADSAGAAAGVAVLVAFLVGLVVSNSIITATASTGFMVGGRNRTTRVALGVVTAGVSIVVGLAFILGMDATLPAFFAG